MTKRLVVRWKLLLGCFGAAVAWDLVCTDILDQGGRLTTYMAFSAPHWLQQVERWTPHFLAVRLLHVFGYRFDRMHYDDNLSFIAVSTLITCAIWTLVLYAVVWAIQRTRERSDEAAAA